MPTNCLSVFDHFVGLLGRRLKGWRYSRGKAQSNKTPALTKSMNMDNWLVGISNQLFIKGS